MNRRTPAAGLPEAARLRARSLGETGRRWLEGLDGRVSQLCEAWRIDIGRAFPGSSESLVAEATLEDGGRAVVKIGMTGASDLKSEANVYRLAAGRGYARLLAYEPAFDALLLERLGAAVSRRGGDAETQIRAICRTLRESWVPVGDPDGLMSGAGKSRWLFDFIGARWTALGAPCGEAARNRAFEFAEEREAAFRPADAVLVHGDAHADNTLLAADPGPAEAPRCKFVDPDGMFAEPASDLAPIMRDWSGELLAGDTAGLALARCDLLAELTGVERRAIWQWGFVERVSTGLVLLGIGMHAEGAEMLAVADRLCAVPAPE